MKQLYRLLLILLAIAAFPLKAQIQLYQINTFYHENFDSLANTGTANDIVTLPHGWLFLETGTNANTTYAASTGSANAGNTYSFGLDNDRALGGLQSGSLVPFIGASFTNQTGTAINGLEIIYQGEQWRLGATGRNDKLDFQYSFTATSLTNGTWIDADELDFLAKISTGTVGLLNGNLPANSDVLSDTLVGLNIAPGATFFIRWTDFNATGADDGMGIDNFSLRPIGVPPTAPSITFSPASLNFGQVTLGSYDTLSYRVITANLTDSIDVTAFSSEYDISHDGVNFVHSLTLDASGGKIYVRFTPNDDGVSLDSILHSSTGLYKAIKIRGEGFSQASHIIPIATARTRPVGERVTVAGRITVGNELGNPGYIQDATGGIPVFDYALANTVHIGDSVIVTGPIGVFNNQVQISGSNIIFTEAGGPPRFIQPKRIRIEQLAAYEGQLVTVQHIRLVNDDFVFYPQSTEVMTNDTTNADLRIDGSTNIPGLDKPDGFLDITGVVGRFRTNAQLMPRFGSDIPGAILPSTPADSIPKSETLDIVNWNLEFFGATREDYPEEYGPADEGLQLQSVRTVLQSLNADIVAVQEVSDDSTFSALVRQLGYNYQAICSDRYSYSFDGPSNTFPPQKVCFIYDTTVVKINSARPLFESLYDSARLYDGSLLPGYPGGSASSFYSSGRLPFLLNATVKVNGVESNISLIDIHAKSGSAAADRERRLYDAAVLKDSLDAHFEGTNFIILGDLNDDLDQSITAGMSSPYQDFVLDSANYFPATKALSDAGARSTVSFNDVIDHQIFSNDMRTQYIAGSTAIVTPFNLIADYATTTSDHLPVISRFLLKAPTVNFASVSKVITEGNTTSYAVAVKVSKAAAVNRSVSIQVSGTATDSLDYNTSLPTHGNIITLPIYADSTTARFTISVVNDSQDELAETAVFTLLQGNDFSVGDSSTVVITIEDNDIPEIAFAQLVGAGIEGGGDYKVKLKLSTAVASTQTVTLQVNNAFGAVYGQDYTTSPAVAGNNIQLTVNAGSTEAAFLITPLRDTRKEIAELITFQIASVSSGLKIKSPNVSVFTILDSRIREIFWRAFPNPTVNSARLQADGLDDSENVSVEVRKSTGELLLNITGAFGKINDQLEPKMQSAPRGIYIIKIIHEGQTTVLRVIKS